MGNDRVFAVYALGLVAGVASVVTACIVAGCVAAPSAGVLLWHLALSVGFRGAYKSYGGFEWAHELAEFAGMITAQAGRPPHTGAEAMG